MDRLTVMADLTAIMVSGNLEALDAAFRAVVESDEFTSLFDDAEVREVILRAEAILDASDPDI